jgi:hypothetical protein
MKKSTPRKSFKILYQFHYGNGQAGEVHAPTLEGAICLFRQLHRDADINEVLLVGRHGGWVSVSELGARESVNEPSS